MDVELVLVLVGSAGVTVGTGEDDMAASRLHPDSQQATLFERMRNEKAPVCAKISRPGPSPGTSLIDSPAAPAGGGATPRPPASDELVPTLVAAVPLMYGTTLLGALWLERPLEHRRGTAAPAPLSPSDLSDSACLRSLGFALSMCLMGSEGGGEGSSSGGGGGYGGRQVQVRWLAGALTRLAAAGSLAALVAQLCDLVSEHLRRRFVLEASVRPALAPPALAAAAGSAGAATEAAPSLGLLLQAHPPLPTPLLAHQSSSHQAGGGVVWNHSTGHGPPGRLLLPLADELRSQSGPQQQQPAATASLVGVRVLGAAGGGAVLATQRSAQRLSVTSPHSHLLPQRPSQAPGQGHGGMASADTGGRAHSRHRLRTAAPPPPLPAAGGLHWANGVSAGILREAGTAATDQLSARLSIDCGGTAPPAVSPPPPAAVVAAPSMSRLGLAATTSAVAVMPVDLLRTASLGGYRAGSSRSIVVQLTAAEAAAAAVGGPLNASAAASVPLPALHARAFALPHTLLGAALQQLQQEREQRAQQQQQQQGGREWEGALGGGSGGKGAPPWVVEDTALHVQDVHKPSADVCLLMGLRRTARGTASGILGMVGSAAGAAAEDGGGGGGGSVPQSLVLLVLPLPGGGALGLYLCFPRRLPGPLLEAVRASGQELLEQALAPLLRSRLREAAIAAEYDTLCSANPGSYAVVHSPSFVSVGRSPLPHSLSAAYVSNVTAVTATSELAGLGLGLGGELSTQQPEPSVGLLSGVLSTADMEVLLAQQAGGAAAGGGGAGGAAPTVPQSGGAGGGSALQARRLGLAVPSLLDGPSSARTGSAASGRRDTAPSATTTTTLSWRAPGTPAVGGSALRLTATGHTDRRLAAANAPIATDLLNLGSLLHGEPPSMLPSPAAVAARSQRLLSSRRASVGSLAELEAAGGFASASVITVAGVDSAAVARQQLELLMSSVTATFVTDPGVGAASSSPMDDLDALELGEMLGKGGGGTVFRGKLGTLDVAVKTR
ncbi:hypothetical protein GPECTOR_74g673 [Gonium pectorale]|uniref:Uncharacterized protein n=1 Tax=Gonium pectorale TaxID=33097 RepID=A0A150G2F6_GONPE|nr:hypothetical protein GPECTOR_74g673 [Gonium pectorale]|eukprot:KXZ44059.1 hypothetical protein GPECTOR_74g673 [Gonium pectorale]